MSLAARLSRLSTLARRLEPTICRWCSAWCITDDTIRELKWIFALQDAGRLEAAMVDRGLESLMCGCHPACEPYGRLEDVIAQIQADPDVVLLDDPTVQAAIAAFDHEHPMVRAAVNDHERRSS